MPDTTMGGFQALNTLFRLYILIYLYILQGVVYFIRKIIYNNRFKSLEFKVGRLKKLLIKEIY